MARFSRSQIAGVVALGALAALIVVGFYFSRQGAGPVEGATAAEAPGSAQTPAAAPLPGERLRRTPGEPLPGTAGKGTVVTAEVEEIMLTPQARLLAERFKCICGCNDILATCNCTMTPGSRDMKKYLQELVTEEKTPAEVEAAMVKRYGEAVRP